ncbi:HNH endonuclease [Roseburia hominis]|uniref:HNH endonuclease signature motif containing protein n=1 Tax=Roseburia hominis TaxID=301301 RepID=UPI001F17C23B|nr:HNH endonuclease [Roseburia hominis]
MKKDNIYLRQAMWKSYKKKCVYCGNLIQPRYIEIDHILPVNEKNIKNNQDPDLKNYIEELKKKGFEKNSVENYMLCCTDCNKKKSNYQFNAANFRFYHEYAARHATDILRRIERIKRGINSFSDEKQKESEVTKYKEKELKCDLQLLNSGTQCYFKYGKGNVRIDAYLPVDYEGTLCCLIFFKELCQTDIFLAYDEDIMKKYFFSGYQTPFNSKERRWCTFVKGEDGEIIYQMNLPPVKLNVSRKTFEQMAVICDKLYEEYIAQISIIDSILDISDFPKISKKACKLFAISEETYKILQKFIHNHNYQGAPDNPYNIFDVGRYDGVVNLQRNPKIIQPGDIYASIEFKQVEDNGYYDVIWSPGYELDEPDKMENFDNKIKWTASYTYDWLINECIPKAFNEYYNKSKSKFQKMFGRYKNTDTYIAQKLLRKRSIISYRNE